MMGELGPTMSSNGSFEYDYDVNLNELPFLENAEHDNGMERRRREEEAEHFMLSRNLALIELSSCFCTGPEPLFDLLSPILWDHNQL